MTVPPVPLARAVGTASRQPTTHTHHEKDIGGECPWSAAGMRVVQGKGHGGELRAVRGTETADGRGGPKGCGDGTWTTARGRGREGRGRIERRIRLGCMEAMGKDGAVERIGSELRRDRDRELVALVGRHGVMTIEQVMAR